ncbi:H-NS histone family protein [Burkholderia oklahomensis]|uniref:H-NS histone family protein n=1 Tax=Burkholderia oklahomensis TaxID=342113 RepID=UPI00264C4D03|nr:H-NS histone family protein [Burkholderia oklahomensis]MDN7675400.1 H-NS histone family protein [Burkholderia oklahomensis]
MYRSCVHECCGVCLRFRHCVGTIRPRISSGRNRGSPRRRQNVRHLSREQINPAWSASAGTRRKEPPPPKYRNPVTGQTWCGRGRTPKWMAGYAREDFLIVPTAQ